jgi:hypothetical protein
MFEGAELADSGQRDFVLLRNRQNELGGPRVGERVVDIDFGDELVADGDGILGEVDAQRGERIGLVHGFQIGRAQAGGPWAGGL